MSRARTVKPEWLEDELLSQSTDGARIMSIALILMADDYGNGRINRLQQATRVFPPPDESPEEFANSCRRFSESLAKLAEIRFIGLYQVNGQHYFTIRKWFDHQKVSHPGKPLVPGPPESFWNSSRVVPEELQKPSALIGSDLIRSDLTRSDLAKAVAASQRPDRLEPEEQRLQQRRESDPKPIPQPAQPAPQPPCGPRPPASGALRSIPTPERQPEPSADISQNCHLSDCTEQPRPPTRRERATSDLASLPIAELARRCRENPHDAGYAAPQDRPEVRQVHEAWCRSVGLAARKLGHLSDRNRQLWAILEALETNSLTDVLRACEQASRDPWCRGEKPGRNGEPGRKRGVEELTPVVLSRLLDAADERGPEIRSPSVQRAMDAVDAVLAGQR